MSKPNKSSEQLVEIDNSIASYHKQLKMLQVEILKLELKKEKLMEHMLHAIGEEKDNQKTYLVLAESC